MDILRFPELKDIIKLSRSTIDRLEKVGDFPKRIYLGKNSVAWCAEDIYKWLRQKQKLAKKNQKNEPHTKT